MRSYSIKHKDCVRDGSTNCARAYAPYGTSCTTLRIRKRAACGDFTVLFSLVPAMPSKRRPEEVCMSTITRAWNSYCTCVGLLVRRRAKRSGPGKAKVFVQAAAREQPVYADAPDGRRRCARPPGPHGGDTVELLGQRPHLRRCQGRFGQRRARFRLHGRFGARLQLHRADARNRRQGVPANGDPDPLVRGR